MAGPGRRKKRRVVSQDEDAARRRFLDALEAQRANATTQPVASNSQSKATPSPPVVSLPGFYYDATKRRYFRSSPPSERRQRAQVQIRPQERQVPVQTANVRVTKRSFEYGATGHNWVQYLNQRQSDFAWSARSRDRRELMPQFLSGFLSSQVIHAQNVATDGRLTALAVHARASNVGALGASSGKLEILGLERQPHEAESATPVQLARPMCDFYVSGVITSLQWRPVQELDLLLCHLGSSQRSGSQVSLGNVCYLRVRDQDTRRVTVVSTAQMNRMRLVDPWTAQWNPTETSKFSVGCGGSSSGVYVDAVANTRSFQRAPSGVLTSDVHAQSFFSTGHVVLNGTKSGGLWGWDVRAPRRIFEWEVKATADRPTGSVLDIHILNDCRRAVVQRSNGELQVVDLRTWRPVVEFIQGVDKHYLPSLRCAVDSNESVVVSGGDAKYPLAVNSYDLRSGRRVASLEVQNAPTSEKQPTFVQQVQLKAGHYGGRFGDAPEIWAISRNELYVCSGPPSVGVDPDTFRCEP